MGGCTYVYNLRYCSFSILIIQEDVVIQPYKIHLSIFAKLSLLAEFLHLKQKNDYRRVLLEALDTFYPKLQSLTSELATNQNDILYNYNRNVKPTLKRYINYITGAFYDSNSCIGSYEDWVVGWYVDILSKANVDHWRDFGYKGETISTEFFLTMLKYAYDNHCISKVEAVKYYMKYTNIYNVNYIEIKWLKPEPYEFF